jgi:methylated-DNA-[protein]-cysteine S-methyltransferase
VDFTVRLAPKGTHFQRRVWDALREIPLGTTTNYGALAAHLGMPSASRAVGAANGKNPISLILPCHRVVGAGGALTGYAGGLELKQWLLEHEATTARRSAGGVTPIALAAVAPRAAQLTLG